MRIAAARDTLSSLPGSGVIKTNARSGNRKSGDAGASLPPEEIRSVQIETSRPISTTASHKVVKSLARYRSALQVEAASSSAGSPKALVLLESQHA
jgi:hypothetical protein